MKILVACEESQRVCEAFRKKGHEAYSCDIQECSGGHPEWHIRDDVLKVLKGGQVITMDGMSHCVPKWDMIIAFPPCTHLAVSGAAWFEKKTRNSKSNGRTMGVNRMNDLISRQAAIEALQGRK